MAPGDAAPGHLIASVCDDHVQQRAGRSVCRCCSVADVESVCCHQLPEPVARNGSRCWDGLL